MSERERVRTKWPKFYERLDMEHWSDFQIEDWARRMPTRDGLALVSESADGLAESIGGFARAGVRLNIVLQNARLGEEQP